MKLLRQLTLLIENFSEQDIYIDSINLNYNNVHDSSNSDYDLECSDVLVSATIDDTDYGLHANSLIYLSIIENDNSFNHQLGSFNPGNTLEITDAKTIITNIKSDNEQDIVKLFGSLENLKKQLEIKISNKLESHIDLNKILQKFKNY